MRYMGIEPLSRFVLYHVLWSSNKKHSTWFAINTGMVGGVKIQECKRHLFVPFFAVFDRFLFRKDPGCGMLPSRTPNVCACFVAACFDFMPGSSATSCITWWMKTLPLSVKLSVGKEACLVMMSIKTFALFTAVGLGSG